jgi:heat-inducible transcriptional repressor
MRISEELGEREREVLRAIVREYIHTAEPVGSAQLARSPEFEVSSATLRTVMGDLEALGYLEKPHTSAGRIPTDRAYRYFVDSLMRLKEPAQKDRDFIEQGITTEGAMEKTLQDTSRVLHFISRHAGLVVAPSSASGRFHRIEFVRLRENRILAILVGQNGEVINRPIAVDFQITPEELVRAGNYLSELLHELPLDGARRKLQEQAEQERALYDQLADKALRLGMAATDLPTGERVLIEGATSFLDAPEFAEVERMRALFKTLEEKNKLISLLEQVQRAREMQIFIGSESDFSSAGELSVIATPYGTSDRVLGTVGIIGPTRMNYSRIVPLVNFTAQVLSRVLENP